MNKVLYVCGDFRVDAANRRLTRRGNEIELEPKAFGVLLLLLERAGELIGRDELLDAVWGHRYVTAATLNRAISMLRRAFDDDADDARFIGTVHGSGYRFIGAVERVSVARSERAAYLGPPAAARLPARLTPLIGRDREIAELGTMLAEHRAVTIIGPGGMGKTQCALELGRLCSPEFSGGVWFFDLSPLEDADEWVRALATALSLPTSRAAAPLARIADALAGRRALLLIDNCDRIAAGIGERVFELLRRCPELKILATSQRRLDFTAEWLMWLPALQLPPSAAEAQGLPLARIAATPAVALLLERARAVQPAISLGPHNLADIVEICHRLDGMPLAIELAAGQLAMLPPSAIRERLAQRFSLPASDSAGRAPRHQTLDTLMDWSYGLLSAQEQRLLCWLGVFQHGWTMDAAESFGSALGVHGETVLQLHSGLIFKSLVVSDPTLSPPRYRLLETVREYALKQLRHRREEAEARNAHLRYFVELAERSHRGIVASQAADWVARLAHEHANIDAALTWAKSGANDDEAALRLAGGLMLYAKSNSLVWLMDEWAERALVGIAPRASRTYVRALIASGASKLYVQNPAIESRLSLALDLAARLGDGWAECCACAYLALWNAHLERFDQARAYAAIADARAREQKDDWLASLVGTAKAWIALGCGAYQEALATLEPLRCLSFDPNQHQIIDVYRGLAHYALGHWRQAAAASFEAQQLSAQMRSLRALAASIEIAAYLEVQAGRPESCARFLGKAADIRNRTRSPLFRFWIADNLKAKSWACAAVGEARFDELHRAGAAARDEVVFDEAHCRLREIADGDAVASHLENSLDAS